MARRGRSALRPNLIKLILACALPAAGLVWFLLLGEEKRQAVVDGFPGGAGERVIHAGIGIAVLMALAWLVLPVVHGVELGLRRLLGVLGRQRTGARVLLFPVELVSLLLRVLFLCLFWLTAVAILATMLACALLMIWIVMPEFLGGSEILFDPLRQAAASVGLTL